MSSPIVPNKYLEEIRVPPQLPIKQGDDGIWVRRVQEWLSLHGWSCICDGDFGPATRRALGEFQHHHHATPTGECDALTYNTLVMPLVRATRVPDNMEDDLGMMVVRIAMQFHQEHAIEVGGDNRGPWQRHFARGRENQPWCQDFASTVWFDAARLMLLNTQALPFNLCDDNDVPSSYVPWVANEAKRVNRYVTAEKAVDVLIPAGAMFFVRGKEHHVHVGLVVNDNKDGTFKTVEGNTNTDGSANGWEVAIRFRSKRNCDFGLCVPQQVTVEKEDAPSA